MDARSATVSRRRLPAAPQRLGRVGVLLAVGLVTCPGVRADPPASPPSYRFGVVPQHTAAELAARWTPLLRYLSDKTGLRLEFRTARDIPSFERRAVQGEYDFVYLNPFQYILFREKVGYRALARERASGLRGIVVVRADAPYRRLRDLEDRALAFPAPSAFAASLVTRAQFRAQGVRIHHASWPRTIRCITESPTACSRVVAAFSTPSSGSTPRCAPGCACCGPRRNTCRMRSPRTRACRRPR